MDSKVIQSPHTVRGSLLKQTLQNKGVQDIKIHKPFLSEKRLNEYCGVLIACLL